MMLAIIICLVINLSMGLLIHLRRSSTKLALEKEVAYKVADYFKDWEEVPNASLEIAVDEFIHTVCQRWPEYRDMLCYNQISSLVLEERGETHEV